MLLAAMDASLEPGASYGRSDPCDLCHSEEFELLSRHDRCGRALDTVICRRCGLVAHGHLPSPAKLASFQACEYRESYHGSSVPSPKRIWKAWQEARVNAQRVIDVAKPEDRVLDLGAGLGCLVRQLTELGFSAEGLEPGRSFQHFAVTALRANVVLGQLEGANIQKTYDIITMLHVVEHLRSPRQALLQVREMLSPGGKLLVVCPNLAGGFATKGRLFHFAHLHNFTRQTFLMLAESCGLQLHKSLAPADGENIVLWLKKGEAKPIFADGSAYRAVLRSIQNCAPWKRYASLRYFRRCLVRGARFFSERLRSKSFVGQLLAKTEGDGNYDRFSLTVDETLAVDRSKIAIIRGAAPTAAAIV